MSERQIKGDGLVSLSSPLSFERFHIWLVLPRGIWASILLQLSAAGAWKRSWWSSAETRRGILSQSDRPGALGSESASWQQQWHQSAAVFTKTHHFQLPWGWCFSRQLFDMTSTILNSLHCLPLYRIYMVMQLLSYQLESTSAMTAEACTRGVFIPGETWISWFQPTWALQSQICYSPKVKKALLVIPQCGQSSSFIRFPVSTCIPAPLARQRRSPVRFCPSNCCKHSSPASDLGGTAMYFKIIRHCLKRIPLRQTL